ncbi:pyroglutamyl-peptidase I [Tessaracoccus oleiagri]|uniref:Pyroglutamyl-peptidase I n=1 Tax=Tessaracoccus oleiagri TaxID=686624 RepID=A0A1G9IET0_9ACTN|nr:pyroglutamyl-peptidase I [Tessaracoccus oleiagri]SDL23545.1 pyroglutamyl-peptidase [Tessaracoccus oleiagri]
MRILVTAFEPFGNDSENASAGALRELLATWRDPAVELVGAELPVVFDDASLRRAVAEYRPDLLVALGEAGGRHAITPERVARNEMSARIPDNAGARPQGEPVETGAPAERATALDVDTLVEAMREAGWAAEPSDEAGRFVCNFVAFHAYGMDVPSVFIHVPAVRSEGEAKVGAETGGAVTATRGREPRTVAELAEALAAALRRLRPSSPPSGRATTA